jgi:hypothetical protein
MAFKPLIAREGGYLLIWEPARRKTSTGVLDALGISLIRKPLNSTSRFPYLCLVGADKTGKTVKAARARTARFIWECMFENICYEWKRFKRCKCNECANEMSGLQGGVGITAMPCKKYKALLTNQCLGKERKKIAERGAGDPSVQTVL